MDPTDTSMLQGALEAALGARYALERQLGRGGMATVYLARDLRHRRPVAVKVLHAELSAALGAERFLREIEVTASLQHPHVLPLFESGEAGGLLYYVMPYVVGETLRARLTRDGARASCTVTSSRRTCSSRPGMRWSRTSASPRRSPPQRRVAVRPALASRPPV